MIEINDLAKGFFDKLGIEYDSLEVNTQDEGIYLIKIETKDSNLVIGPHGKNLDDICSVLRLMVSKKCQSRIKLHIEVNDYLKTKDERLIDFLKSKISLLEKNGEEIILPYFSAYDRKKIHSYVTELKNSSISTKSVGEGRDRKIHLCKTGSKLSLDIDGEDI